MALVTPMSYGAAGNGSTNDATAINSAVAALAAGDTLWIDRSYGHSSVITMNKNNVTVTGGGEFRALAEATSAFVVTGNHVTADDLWFTCPTTTTRGTTTTHHKFQIQNNTGFYGHKIRVDGSAAAGIFAYGATEYHFDDCYVANTRADAFHNVKGSSYGLFTHCEAYNVGDDSFAAVGYSTGGDAGLTHHIRFHHCRGINPVGATLNKGRLFGAVGVTDVEFVDCYGEGSYAAGLVVGTETAFSSYNTSGIRVDGMELRRANTLSGPTGSATRPDHGAVIVSAELGTITDVKLRKLTIVDTDTAVASRNLSIIESGGSVSDIVFDGVNISGGPTQPFYTNAATTDYQLIDVKGAGSSWGWELLGRAEFTAAAATTGAITVGARDELMIVVRINGLNGATDIPALRFNGDAGNNYWDRHLSSAAGAATFANVQNASTSMARLTGQTGQSVVREIVAFVANQPGWQKVGTVTTGTGTGNAATIGALEMGGFQWNNTATQITSVELRTAGGVQMNADCGILIFGRDLS